MFNTTIQPRFGDTDLLGHINNTVLAGWFETARNPILRIFISDFTVDIKTFPLIVAHTEYFFLDQIYYQHEVEIRTWISKIGNKSFTVHQEARQEGRLCVFGSAVVVHYDYATKQSTPLPDEKIKQLEEYLYTGL